MPHAPLDQDRMAGDHQRADEPIDNPQMGVFRFVRGRGGVGADAVEETHGDEETAQRGRVRGALFEERRRESDGEWKDHPSGDLERKWVDRVRSIDSNRERSQNETTAPGSNSRRQVLNKAC